MKKKVILVLLLFLCLSPLAAQSDSDEFTGPYTEPLPYEEIEFPDWAWDVRRLEVIFFGSVPLTYILTNLVYDISIYASHEWDNEYRMGTARTQDDIKFMLTTSLYLSGGIAVTDFILGKIFSFRERQSKE